MARNIVKTTALVLGATAVMLTAGGCTSKFEEINTNPDALAEGVPTNQLGYVLRYVAAQYGALDATGIWAGYITTIQYGDTYSYLPTNNTYGNKFGCCYRCTEQLKDILVQTEEKADELRNLRWAVRITQQFLWLWTTDQFGPIPYTEANGLEENTVNAKYDAQDIIYAGVLADLKTIADEMASLPATGEIGAGDFLFKGDAALWRKFCNSLRLRAAMRIVNVNEELAKRTVEEIGGDPATYPVLDSSADNAYFNWTGSDPYIEPFADNAQTRDDHGMSDIFINYLAAMQDPRIESMAKSIEENSGYSAENEVEGTVTYNGHLYKGYPNGMIDQATLSEISRMGAMYRDAWDGFTPILKSCENYFLLAEGALRGWNVGITAKEAYEKAVRLSMDDNHIAADDADAYLAAAGAFQGTLEQVYMEAWVALYKNNVEAWSNYRRTGYPKLIPQSGNYPGAKSAWGEGAHNDVPFRMPYPDNEYNYNTANVNAASANIVDYTWGEQMWWDTRTGVY